MAFEPIADVYRGVRFRQLAPKLRWPVGPGFANQVESTRPRNERTGQFLDPEGTFITFDDDARVNVGFLLKTGALVIDDTNQRRGEKATKAGEQAVSATAAPLSERPVADSSPPVPAAK